MQQNLSNAVRTGAKTWRKHQVSFRCFSDFFRAPNIIFEVEVESVPHDARHTKAKTEQASTLDREILTPLNKFCDRRAQSFD